MQAQAFDPWQIGELLCGQYRIVERLSQNDRQNVQRLTYRADHEGWGQPVRLKVFLAQPETLQNKAQAWSRLSLHPLIASCYYLRDLRGYGLLISEYVAGVPLSPPLSRRRCSPHEAELALETFLDAAIQTAWGLEYAHGQGVVHGNWQWCNLIQTSTGQIRITDFWATPQATIADDQRDWVKLFAQWSQALPRCPKAINAHLQQWQAAASFLWRDCWQTLQQLYQDSLGQPYPRTRPEPDQWQASGLNNQALAWMDLAEPGAALRLWEQVQQAQPTHPETLYNQGLWQWRSHQISLETLLNRLATLPWYPATWRGFLELEAGNGAAALAAFEQWQPEPSQPAAFIQQAKALATQRQSQTAAQTISSPSGMPIQTLIYSPDGRYMVWGDVQGNLLVWDFQLGQRTRFSGHSQASIVRLALTTDNCYLVSIARADTHPQADIQTNASANADLTLKLWSFRTGKCLATFSQLQDWQSLGTSPSSPVTPSPATPTSQPGRQQRRWSADGRYCLRVTNALLTLVEKASGQVIYALHLNLTPVFPIPKTTLGLSWQPQAGASRGAAVQPGQGGAQDALIWDLATQTPRQVLPVGPGCSAIALMPPLPDQPATYLTVDQRGVLTQRALANGQSLATWFTAMSNVTQLHISTDGQLVLLQGQHLSLWSLATGQPKTTIESLTPSPNSVVLSPDGQTLLWADRQVHLRPVATAAWQYQAPWQLSPRMRGTIAKTPVDSGHHYLQQAEQAWQQRDIAQTYAALQQANTLLSAPERERVFEFWTRLYTHLPRQRLRRTWPLYTFAAHIGAIQQIAFDRDGALITSSRNGTLKRWLLQTERALGTIIGQPKGGLSCFSISADRQWLITSSQQDGLQQWQTRSGKLHRTLTSQTRTTPIRATQPSAAITALAALPASPYVLAGTEQGKLQLWHLEMGSCLRDWTAHSQAIAALAVSPDSRYGVSADAKGLWKRWHLATGECQQTISTAQSGIRVIAYSSDGQWVLTAAQDHSIMVWSALLGKRHQVLRGHQSPITSLWIAPDSRYVLSGSSAGRAKFWDLRTGACLHTWDLGQHEITAVAVERTSKYVLLGTATGEIHLWAMDWQLAPPREPYWDETARPYLEAFLVRHTPRQPTPFQRGAQDRTTAEPLAQSVRQIPLGMGAFWLVMLWLGTITYSEIFTYTSQLVSTGLLAGGAALFVWSYFTSRQTGNPTIQLGALFGLVVLALVGLVERSEGWLALGAVCWGTIAAVLVTGPMLGLWHPQPAVQPLGLKTSQTLKKYWGRTRTIVLLLMVLGLGLGLETIMVNGVIPRLWPVGVAGSISIVLEAIAWRRQGWQGQRLLKRLAIVGLVTLTSFTWFLPSRLGVVPERACSSPAALNDYLARGGTPNGQVLAPPTRSLLECALVHPDPALLGILINHQADLNQLNEQGEGLLHLAVQAQVLSAVKSLLAGGSNINLPDRQGRIALHDARTAAMARVLIRAGADVNWLAPQAGSPLQQAIRNDRLDIVQLLLSHQANPDLTCDQVECEDYSPIYSAIRHGRWEILRLLLTYDVDLTVRDRNQQTPLEYAQSLNQTQAVTVLQAALEPQF
ncbi:MAG: ankyrin repeat domain-containing protein [Cyanobacteria bacterium P01_G01_bin.54]